MTARLRLRLCAALATAAAAWSAPTPAHHSFAAYDKSKIVTLNGSVKAFQWVNPHVIIWVYVQPKDHSAPELWSVETTSPGVLTRSGWTRTSLKPGDRVSVDLNPLRDGSHGGGMVKVTLADTGQVLFANFAAGQPAGAPGTH